MKQARNKMENRSIRTFDTLWHSSLVTVVVAADERVTAPPAVRPRLTKLDVDVDAVLGLLTMRPLLKSSLQIVKRKLESRPFL